jgi:crossover junction endodeoxyribonuclease RusA
MTPARLSAGEGGLVQLSLPFPPTTNNLFRNAGRKRVRTAAYDAWFALASTHVKDGHRQNLGAYCLSICLKRPDKRRRDIGNLEKAVSDLLVAHGVVRDDSLCERLTMQWDAGMKEECVVLVMPAEEALAA